MSISKAKGGRKLKKTKAVTKVLFSIKYDELISSHMEQRKERIAELKAHFLQETWNHLAPPTIEDLFLQDPLIKCFRKYILRAHGSTSKEFNFANYLIALREVEQKLDHVDLPDLCKQVASNFLFNKHPIQHNLDLDDKVVDLISKRNINFRPGLLLFLGAVIKEWFYENLWSDFIRKSFSEKKVAYDKFYTGKELLQTKKFVMNKKLAKNLMFFATRATNFLRCISNPGHCEEFRNFLVGQRRVIDKDTYHLDKVILGKSHKIAVYLSRLPRDLDLLCEARVYKDMILFGRQAASGNSFTFS